MARYIDADKLLLHLNDYALGESPFPFDESGCKEAYEAIQNCMKAVEEQPTADVVPIVHGEWLRHEPNPRIMEEFHEMGIGKGMSINSIYWTCSECGCWGTPSHNYCFKCGAKMDGKENKDEM